MVSKRVPKVVGESLPHQVIYSRYKIHMKTLKQIQEEHKTWAAKNFPNSKSDHPLLGVIEELGELCHAQLKEEQEIRTPPEGWQVHKKDAVGDIMIYLIDYCNKEGLAVTESRQGDYDEYGLPLSTLLFDVAYFVGQLCNQHVIGVHIQSEEELKADQNHSVCNIVTALSYYCLHMNVDLLSVLNETWEKVSKRDWSKDPTTGGESK